MGFLDFIRNFVSRITRQNPQEVEQLLPQIKRAQRRANKVLKTAYRGKNFVPQYTREEFDNISQARSYLNKVSKIRSVNQWKQYKSDVLQENIISALRTVYGDNAQGLINHLRGMSSTEVSKIYTDNNLMVAFVYPTSDETYIESLDSFGSYFGYDISNEMG